MSYLDNIRTFTRVYELGSMSAAGRDLRISPAVTSARISQLEDHLSVRLFQRTTRSLSPTDQGRAFYPAACEVLAAVEAAEAQVSEMTEKAVGRLNVAAPLGVGRRLIAPLVPEFMAENPQVDVRLRLSDRNVDMLAEGMDLLVQLGHPPDSSLKMRKIGDVERVLCAAPDYIQARGNPEDGDALVSQGHDCLNLRFPGAQEFRWRLQTEDGPRQFAVQGRLECDDADVLLDWALAGQGILMAPCFGVAEHIAEGRLVPVAVKTPPVPVQMVCLYVHRRHQDLKTRRFIEFIAPRIGARIRSRDTAS